MKNDTYYTYEQAVTILIKKLDKLDNIKDFCLTNDLPYTSIIALKNKTNKKDFPELVEKALNLLGVKVEYQRIYKKLP